MKLSQLNYFLTVCKYHNITKAAGELHVSQPSITMSIKELEAEFKINLFHRINKRLELTPEGEIFYKRAEQILKDTALLEADMNDLTGNRNHIKLGLPLQIGASLLPSLMKDFQKDNPEICLELIECGAMDIVEMLLNEQIDMAIASIQIDNSNLKWVPLFETEIGFCIHSAHPLAQEKFISFAQACEIPSVMFPNSFFTYKRIWERADLEQLTPDIRLYTKQLHTIKNLIVNADFGSFLLKEAVILDKDIACISFHPPIRATVGMITKKGRHVYQDSMALMSFIKSKYSSYRQIN